MTGVAGVGCAVWLAANRYTFFITSFRGHHRSWRRAQKTERAEAKVAAKAAARAARAAARAAARVSRAGEGTNSDVSRAPSGLTLSYIGASLWVCGFVGCSRDHLACKRVVMIDRMSEHKRTHHGL